MTPPRRCCIAARHDRLDIPGNHHDIECAPHSNSRRSLTSPAGGDRSSFADQDHAHMKIAQEDFDDGLPASRASSIVKGITTAVSRPPTPNHSIRWALVESRWGADSGLSTFRGGGSNVSAVATAPLSVARRVTPRKMA